MNTNKENIKSRYMLAEGGISVVTNIFLFFYKYFVGMSIGSLALMADAWHTLSDCISSIVVIVGGFVSKKPADKEHPFGHGRVELITSFIVGIMLFFVAYSFASESIKNFWLKKEAVFGKSAIIVMIVSILIKEALAQYSFYVAKKSNSYALKADAWHHRSDALTSVIILIGIIIGRSFWWMDSILSFIVSLVIFYAAYDVIKSAVKPLIGEVPPQNIIEEIEIIASNIEGVDKESFHHFHFHRYGEHSELTFHLRFPKDTTVFEAHEIVSRFEKSIKDKLAIDTTIHIESQK